MRSTPPRLTCYSGPSSAPARGRARLARGGVEAGLLLAVWAVFLGLTAGLARLVLPGAAALPIGVLLGLVAAFTLIGSSAALLVRSGLSGPRGAPVRITLAQVLVMPLAMAVILPTLVADRLIAPGAPRQAWP